MNLKGKADGWLGVLRHTPEFIATQYKIGQTQGLGMHSALLQFWFLVSAKWPRLCFALHRWVSLKVSSDVEGRDAGPSGVQ